MKRLVLAMILCFAVVGVAHAAPLKLAWNASPSADVIGYKLYQGVVTGVYTAHVDVGDVREYTYTSLPDGVHYFAATCYDLAGNESTYSNELKVVLSQGVVDITAPGPPTLLRVEQ